MCIYTHGSHVFMIAHVNLLSLAARLTTVSLDIYSYVYMCIHMAELT